MPERFNRPELLMPVSDEGAALQFFVEAMKANTATLQSVSKTMQGIQEEQKETLRLVHDTRERVIRIESGGTSELLTGVRKELEAMTTRVNELERKEDRREGALSLSNWLLRYGPILAGFLALVVVVLAANEKL